MRCLLREIVTDGGIKGDISGLEDPTAIDKIKELMSKLEE
jgi:hypothetical protein